MNWESLNHICKLICPNAKITCKACPKCSKLTTIARSWEFPFISADIAKNTSGKEPNGAFDAGYIFRKAGGYYDKAGETVEPIRKSNGWLLGRIPNQVLGASLEWPPLGRVSKYGRVCDKSANGGHRENTVVFEEDGCLRADEGFDSISCEPSQLAYGKLPYSFGISKIREIV